MNILKKILNLLRFQGVPELKNTTRKKYNLGLKQKSTPPSIKDLEKAGLIVQETNEANSLFKKIGKEKLIYSEQLPPHIFPWVIGMANGLYLIKFPPDIQAQINSGLLNLTGSVVRNPSGQIMAHGSPASLLSLSPIILYQLVVIVFGAYHLKKINESLEKISKKLDEIFAFQLDKRTAQINSHFQEFFHISKGILEFKEKGNIDEVLKRIDMIKSIRLMNLTNLLHLQKNLKDKEYRLKNLKESSFFRSKKGAEQLMDLVKGYERDVVDYQSSLLLDIILIKSEVLFSVCKSNREIGSRIKAQEEQLDFFQTQKDSFENLLNKKIPELICGIFEFEETSQKRRKEVRNSWKALKKTLSERYNMCKAETQSIKEIIELPDNIIFLKTRGNIEKKVA